jgi:hypothetical protein
MRVACAIGSVLLVAGCSVDTHAIGGPGDAATADSAVGDGSPESSTPDGSSMDSSAPDGSLLDSSMPDSSMPDSSMPDSMMAMDTNVDTGCEDDDGDGVCNIDDACPGGDDGMDVDGDGRPDDCDDCPIDGPAATPIPSTVTDTSTGITISNVSLNSVGNVITVSGGDAVTVDLDYSIRDCDCPGCFEQIEIGFVPGVTFSYCAYDSLPGCSGDTGSDTGTLRAPGSSGIYYIRFGRAQNYDCDHTDWWMGTPPAARTIAAICVR